MDALARNEEHRMPIIELRQYTMVPGRRNDFVEIFDREFVETQEALGIEVVGQFVDLDRADRYVWMRRFPDMESRRLSLEAFYSGPAWERHKDAANATMTEWHDVLLLKPAPGSMDLQLDPDARSGTDGNAAARPLSIVIWDVEPEDLAGFSASFGAAHPGAKLALVTEASENTYPRLPIRDDASAFVAVFPSLANGPPDVAGRAPAQVLNLAPTRRSLLRGA
jgi:hypothetical protein